MHDRLAQHDVPEMSRTRNIVLPARLARQIVDGTQSTIVNGVGAALFRTSNLRDGQSQNIFFGQNSEMDAFYISQVIV